MLIFVHMDDLEVVHKRKREQKTKSGEASGVGSTM